MNCSSKGGSQIRDHTNPSRNWAMHVILLLRFQLEDNWRSAPIE